MRRFATLWTITAIALTVTACNQTADNRDADIKAIQNDEIRWNQDYVRKDQERIVAHYADAAIIMVPGTPATSGKDIPPESM